MGENASSTTRVLIVGAAGWQNAGDDLIALRIREWLNGTRAEVRFLGGTEISSLGPGSVMSGGWRGRLRTVREILLADVIVIGGGGLLDDRYPSFYRAFTRVARLAALLHKKYGFVGLGVGPVRTPKAARAYRLAASPADFVWVRDEESRQRLLDVGISPASVEVRGDVVTWVRSSRAEHVDFDFAINLRGWGHVGPGDGGLATGQIADAVRRFIEMHPGARIALISMSRLAGEDDSDAMRSLRQTATRMVSSANAGEVEDIVSRSGVVISMRLHGCLIAASHGIPAVGLAYDPKISQQGKLIGFPTLTLEEATNPASLAEAVRAAKLGASAYLLPTAPDASSVLDGRRRHR